MEKRARGEGAFRHVLPADDGSEPERRQRGSFAKAMEVASDRLLLNKAIGELNQGFWAKGTLSVKRIRRAEITKLALTVTGGREPLPLAKQTVEMVAAALKAAKLASADQYLNELKLMHVEAGFPMEAWLGRTFQLCKKSVSRDRGPIRKAPEVPLDKVFLQDIPGAEALPVPLAIWAYAWGVTWMLREIELSRVKWGHVSWNVGRKTVRLFIPRSKGDQMGLGVARTLQCCGEKPCWTGCAWAQLQGLRQRRGQVGVHSEEPMFPNKEGMLPTKTEMVNSWKTVLDPNMSGHSARRSGAMAYVKKGMDIKDLAYLGRWRSSVVLSYAEEALESVPANQRIPSATSTASTSSRNVVVTPVVKEKKTPEPKTGVTNVGGRPKPVELWVRSTDRRGNNPIHLISAADWSIPMAEWSTACGWTFARKSAHIAFVTDPSMAVLKCKKCLSMRPQRDDVRKGVSPAQLMALDMAELTSQPKTPRLVSQPKTPRSCGKQRPQNPPLEKIEIKGGGWV